MVQRSVWSTLLVASVLLASCGGESPEPDDGGSGGATGGVATGVAPGTGGLVVEGGTGPGGAPEPPVVPSLPALLSETGLYAEDGQTLAEGVLPYEPLFALWTDGAEKRRYVYLPPGARIDTSDMDYWSYPIGTKLWKEFWRDGLLVETRLMEKRPSGAWWRAAYLWRDDGSDADKAPDGVVDARGTAHDVPSVTDCGTCHAKMADTVLGFTAIQLSHSGEGVTLQTLIDEDRLTDPPSGPFVVPGSETEREALGYLHANCGHCHHPGALQVSLDLWLRVDELDAVTTTQTYLSTVGVDAEVTVDAPPTGTKRIVAGDPEQSVLFTRLTSRGNAWDMPPLGSEEVDADAEALLSAFIEGLE